ncbi:hypothetical protein LMG31841_02372 [Paraburkholderia saeva]|uniref:Uncharacterized protein n=1 Tax=Paraburkholderia saeva TaxID=2777537 RepID=A0A9N8RW79_9BURK|nr:hypothetical protein LMG31841_02372 [Paraburkholderia saeva]
MYLAQRNISNFNKQRTCAKFQRMSAPQRKIICTLARGLNVYWPEPAEGRQKCR